MKTESRPTTVAYDLSLCGRIVLHGNLQTYIGLIQWVLIMLPTWPLTEVHDPLDDAIISTLTIPEVSPRHNRPRTVAC